jgi:HlyD family secretion protein
MNTTIVSPQSVADRLGVGQAALPLGHLRRWLVTGALVAAIVAVGFFVWSRREYAQAVQYVTQPVTRGDLRVTVTATGSLAPTNQVQVGSELSGIVKSVTVDYDQRVKVGQLLAQLDTTKLEAQISQTEAALAAARAKIQQTVATEDETRTQLTRTEELAARQLIARSGLDTARATYRRAEADHASAAAAAAQTEAVLRANRADLAKMTIRSPINGVVLTRAVERGQTVAASFQAPVLFTLAEDLTKMELDVDVDEADVGQVTPGQEATFTVDAYPDRTFTARIAAVRFGSQKTEGVVTYKSILHVDNADLLLRPGMTATADLVVKQVTNVLLVPNAAFRFVPSTETQETTSTSGGSLVSRLMPRRPSPSATSSKEVAAEGKRQRVWVLRDGQPVAVSITVGATDGRMSEAIDGDIQPGSVVIVETTTKGTGS